MFTIRDVIKGNYRDRIEAEIPHEPKTKEYIAAYQGAVTKVINNLDGDDLEEVENLVKEWNKEGASKELQLK
jgi:hypothetical protein